MSVRKNQNRGSASAQAASSSEAAAALGLQELSLWLHQAAGFPGTPDVEDLLPVVTTQAEAADFFGVTTRTIREWCDRGCPGRGGQYALTKMLAWRRKQKDPEDWHRTGNRNCEPRGASGELARAILRFYRLQLPALVMRHAERLAKTKLPQKAREQLIQALVDDVESIRCAGHADVERVVEQCWGLV